MIETTHNKSSFIKRIVAFIIDHYFTLFFALSIILLILGPNFIEENLPSELNAVINLFLITFVIAYFCKDLINGISFGRWIMGIMVRDANNPNKIPSTGRLFIRNSILIIWPIEFLVLLFSNENKRLGDDYCKTIVLNNPEASKPLYRTIALIAISLIFAGYITIFALTMIKSSDPYKTAIRNIESNTNILQETGEIRGYGLFPSANIRVINNHGHATLTIKVIGILKDLEVSITLDKEPNERWTVTELKKLI